MVGQTMIKGDELLIDCDVMSYKGLEIAFVYTTCASSETGNECNKELLKVLVLKCIFLHN